LDELSSADRKVCQVLASLGVILNTAELIKNEYSPIGLAGYIGIGILSQPSSYITLLISLMSLLTHTISSYLLDSYLLFFAAGMVLNAEK